MEPIHALVVDDEFNNRDFAERLLHKAGLQVSSAGSGLEAITLAKQMPALSLALIDFELPDMNGIDLVASLRRVMPHVTLVMATMHDDSERIDAAFDAGVKVFLVKPNGFIELYRALLQGESAILSDSKRYIIDQYGSRLYRGKVHLAVPA